MNGKNIIYGLAIVACTSLLFSCNGDKEKEINQIEGTALIASSTLSLQNTTTDLNNEQGYKAIKKFKELIKTPRTLSILEINQAQLQKFDLKVNGLNALKDRKLDDDCLDLNEYIEFILLASRFTNGNGTYTIDAEGNQTNYVPTPTNAIVVVIPFNNGTATVTFSDITTTMYQGDEYLSGIKCTIKVGDATVCSMSHSGTINTTATNVTMNSTTNITLGNYEFSQADEQTLSITMLGVSTSTKLKKSGVMVYGEKANFSISTSAGSINLTSILTIGGIEFRINMVATADQMNNPNININDVLTVEVYTIGGNKVGHFEFISESDEPAGYFIFNDGTRVKAEVVMPDLFSYMFDFIEGQFNFMD